MARVPRHYHAAAAFHRRAAGRSDGVRKSSAGNRRDPARNRERGGHAGRANPVNDGRAGKRRIHAALSFERLLPLGLLLLGLVLFFALGLQRYVSRGALRDNRQALVQWVAQAGLVAWLAYIGVYALIAAFSIPAGALATIVGGFLFGPALGGGLAVVGATAGATVLFLAARHAFADYLRARAGTAVQRMEQGFNENALSYLLFLRLVPVFPFFLVNLAPALLGVSLGTYVLGTAIGIIPGALVYASVGDGLGAVLDAGQWLDTGIIFKPRFFAPILGLALLALAPVAYKKLRRR
jgi:uncharacterized membrane protein YdjX (TVP38/TMEM64 family)